MYRDYKQPDHPTHIYYLRSGLDHKHFEFLFYIYNRGGLFTQRTMQEFYDVSQSGASKYVRRLIEHKAVVPIFDRNNFLTWQLRTAPQMYRVSNRFLNAVDSPNSSIRKIRDIKKAVRFLNAAHVLLKEPFKDWTLLNKAARRGFLTGTYQVPDQAMPRYWVGTTHKEGVVSLNQEMATKGDDHLAIIFFQQHTFTIQTEFEKHFLGKWKNLLMALPPSLDLEIYAISDTELGRNYLANHPKNKIRFQPRTREKTTNTAPMNDLERFMAISRGEQIGGSSRDATKRDGIPPFQHIHYAEISHKYGLDQKDPNTTGVSPGVTT